MNRVDEATGEIATLGYDTSRLQDFGDFVTAGLEEIGKRDRSSWALGDAVSRTSQDLPALGGAAMIV